MYRRHYPHHHYYVIGGYRGHYYQASFAGFIAFVGIWMLLIGMIIGLEQNDSIFHPLFWVGVGLITLGILWAIMANSRMARLRQMNQQYDQQNFYDNQPQMQTGAPVSGTSINPQMQQQQQRSGRCQSCGTPGTGSFCGSCGSRM
jgi:membrane protein insertase Oxa1/YidC/SpoIIIJ